MLFSVLLLLPLTALALGAVQAPIFTAMELVIFGAGAAWTAHVALGLQRLTRANAHLGWLGAAVLAVPALIACQLVPMPPALLAHLAPASYAAYKAGLPGWPEDSAYSWIKQAGELSPSSYFPPTSDEVSHGALVPFEPAGPPVRPLTAGIKAGAWMPVSVAPLLTAPALLKVIAYSTVFLVLVLYPFSARQERLLAGGMVSAALLTGLMISLVGLAEQVHSNGKPLWLFSPYEWPHGSPWGLRVYGSFANPDHYADYLAMAWPFALIGLLLPGAAGEAEDRMALPIISGAVGLAILAALIVTGSRGGWLAAAVATMVVLLLMRSRPVERRPSLLAMKRSRPRLLMAGFAVTAGLCLVLAFTNTSNRGDADRRLASAMNTGGYASRGVPAMDSIAMIRQSPLLGIGLGAWPEIYPKYASPPWVSQYMNAAHNEYIQWTAETGSLGSLLAVAVLYLAIGRVRIALPGLSFRRFPAAIACAGALGGIAAHSFFDFPLRLPANALFAAACLGIVLRLCSPETNDRGSASQPGLAERAGAGFILVLFLVAIAASLAQPQVPYPFDLSPPASAREAVAQILRYPTQPRLHLALAALIRDGEGSTIKRQEIAAALKLEPDNPLARDLYASELARAGENHAALSQIEESVFAAPDASSHIYMLTRYFFWLTGAENAAIERGLRRAVAAKYEPAALTLTQFYDALGRFHEEGQLLANQAQYEAGEERRATAFNQAGVAYLRAADPDSATQAFKLAIAADPADPAAYKNLALRFYGQHAAFDEARRVLDEGLANGAPAVPLYLTLARLERDKGDLEAAGQTLEQAAVAEPGNLDLVRGLADTYFARGKFDRAAIWYRKAIQLAPGSAESYFALGRAEEACYQYFAADHDLARAVALNSGRQDYRAYYAEFKQKVANARTP
jgi:O-antigen ligase/tetratricopeptide (TPR) repeat protein